METQINTPDNAGSKTGRILPWIAGGAFVALGGANVFLFDRVNSLESQLTQVQTASQAELQTMRDASAAFQASLDASLAQMSSHMDEGAKNSIAAAQKAALNAQKNAEKLVQQLAAQQKESDEQIAKALGEVKTLADSHSAQVTGLETNVTAVKDEVTKAKTQIDETIASLTSMRGDLGIQSGLIATNSKELQALRELGDRQYYEFTIRKGAGPAKIGNMTVELKKADPKRNKYNINIVADDKRVEKKDRTVNEPVQMYVSGSRQPYEIVVNSVQKNAIVGYLAMPKVLQSRR